MARQFENEEEFMKLLDATCPVDQDDENQTERKELACLWLGHSEIVSMCFYYVSCGRCEKQIGDQLGGFFDTSNCVIDGHLCDTCKANFEKLDWRHKVLTPDPFKEPKGFLGLPVMEEAQP